MFFVGFVWGLFSWVFALSFVFGNNLLSLLRGGGGGGLR